MGLVRSISCPFISRQKGKWGDRPKCQPYLLEKPSPKPKVEAKPTREVPTKSPSKKKAKVAVPRGKGTDLVDLGAGTSK